MTESITAKGAAAGKWIGSIAIGGNAFAANAAPVDALRATARAIFMSPIGGNYRNAFDIKDYDEQSYAYSPNLTPKLDDVIAAFGDLAEQIRDYRQNEPKAPTLVLITIAGHGASNASGTTAANAYELMINEQNNEVMPSVQLASLLKGLVESGADEVLVIMQSCFSGAAMHDLRSLQPFIASLNNHLGKSGGRMISVITPVNEFFWSPVWEWENTIRMALEKTRSMPGDFVTYKMFKDVLVKQACASKVYRPRESSLLPRYSPEQNYDLFAAVDQGAKEAESRGLYSLNKQLQTYELRGADEDWARYSPSRGIDPQFFDSIDENLPLLLTHSGYEKWQNGSLKIPPPGPRKQNVAVSDATRSFCQKRKNLLVPLVRKRIAEVLNLPLNPDAAEPAPPDTFKSLDPDAAEPASPDDTFDRPASTKDTSKSVGPDAAQPAPPDTFESLDPDAAQ